MCDTFLLHNKSFFIICWFVIHKFIFKMCTIHIRRIFAIAYNCNIKIENMVFYSFIYWGNSYLQKHLIFFHYISMHIFYVIIYSVLSYSIASNKLWSYALCGTSKQQKVTKCVPTKYMHLDEENNLFLSLYVFFLNDYGKW